MDKTTKKIAEFICGDNNNRFSGASEEEKYKRFFRTDLMPAILANRINKENSHLCGVLERGGLPIEVPEMNANAKLIIDRIKTLDEGQYNSLLTSIGITPEVTT